MSNYWEPVEKQWLSCFNNEMTSYFSLVEDTHALVAELAQHPEIVKTHHSPSEYAERLLLRRCGEELRAVDLMARGGHGYQAISAEANLFEQSHMLTYVRSEDAIAEEYLNWSRPHTAFISVKDSVVEWGKLRGWQQARIDQEYDIYRVLCSFKHNNPMFFRVLSLGDKWELFLCQLALTDACWFTLTTIGILALSRFTRNTGIEFITRVNDQMDRARDLFPKFPAIE